MSRLRFVDIAVTAALAAATVTAIGLVQQAVASGGTASTFVPIPPCRLADTRPPTDNVGLRNTPIAAGEAATFTVWGTNGNCTIPTTATAVSTNVTAVGPTAASFLSLYPADVVRPNASSLNYIAGAPPTPNAVTVTLSADGKLNAYNNSGTVDIIIDIVGYYTPAGAGPAGPAGPAGAAGPAGPAGPAGAAGPQYGRTISSTTTVDSTGSVGQYTSITIGASGNPVIAYQNAISGDLKVAACTTPTCTTATTTAVDTTGSVGQYTSITIGTDGNPIISYNDATNGHPKVAACTTPTCTTATTTAVDTSPGSDVGYFSSITIGTDGNPIISYNDDTNGDLKVAACTTPTCTTATTTTLDTTGLVGQFTSITIGTYGNPIVSYHDATNGDLKVAMLRRTGWTPNSWGR